MMVLTSNSQRWRWLFTLIALVVLFMAGVLVSLLASSTDFSSHQFDGRGLLIWRLTAYSLLLWLWPYLIEYLLKRFKLKGRKKNTRLHLVVLIILYEFLIVQNPLQALLSLGGL